MVFSKNMACQPPLNGSLRLFQGSFHKGAWAKRVAYCLPLGEKKISLTSKEHQDNQDLTVEMIRPSNPKVFLPKACWMMYVFKTVRTSSKIPRSFWTRVSDVPKNGLQQVFLKDHVDLYKMRVWNSLEVFQTQVILTKPWFKTILWGFSNPNLLLFGWFLPPTLRITVETPSRFTTQKSKQTPRLATRLPCHSRCFVQRRLGLMQIWKMLSGAVETVDTDTVVMICIWDSAGWFCGMIRL